jgi:hypothetical protein
MDPSSVLNIGIWVVFIALTIAGLAIWINSLVHSAQKKDGEYHPSRNAAPAWHKTIFKMLVRPPYQNNNLYNPLDRLYWPEYQQPNNRVGRRSRARMNRAVSRK